MMSKRLGIKFENLPGGDVKLTQPKLLKNLFKEYEEELRNRLLHRGCQHRDLILTCYEDASYLTRPD